MVKPRIAIVSPASPFRRDEFEAGVAELKALGFEPVYDERVFARRGYVAGEPQLRAAALHDAWSDPSIAALVGVRGGYGSLQVLPLLDAGLARNARKPFVGYSDLTSILTFLTGTCGLVAFHGPMVAGPPGASAAASRGMTAGRSWRASRARSLPASWPHRGWKRSGRAKRQDRCSAARSRSSSARSARRTRSIRLQASYCSWTRSGNGRTASTGCSRSSG
jgi:muramoyltetrapeptide carboxypeptidase LdcA involved in peptidoglycan recycling